MELVGMEIVSANNSWSNILIDHIIGNILVNAMTLGLVKKDKIFLSKQLA